MENEKADVRVVKWESVNPEILGLIFGKIYGAEEIVRTGLVCKRWLKVVEGPYCWTEIDLSGWCRRVSDSPIRDEMSAQYFIDQVVTNLVRRSQGSVRSLSVNHGLAKFGFASVANMARLLRVLKIQGSQISDDKIENLTRSLVNLKEVDISFCSRITHLSLSYFGESCQSLTILRRNMASSSPDIDEDEAYAIANTMRGLSLLEVANGRFSDVGLIEILSNCGSLKQLNVRGCIHVSADLKVQCQHLFMPPSHDDDDDADDGDGDGDDGGIGGGINVDDVVAADDDHDDVGDDVE